MNTTTSLDKTTESINNLSINNNNNSTTAQHAPIQPENNKKIEFSQYLEKSGMLCICYHIIMYQCIGCIPNILLWGNMFVCVV